MFTDVYNRGKHYKPFSSSLLLDVMGSGKKAHFNQCLTMLGTTKTRYNAIYFVQNYVLKCKLLKAIWGPEKKANSECFSHPAALAGSDKKRSMANLAVFTVNWEPRENIRRINNTADLLLTKLSLC